MVTGMFQLQLSSALTVHSVDNADENYYISRCDDDYDHDIANGAIKPASLCQHSVERHTRKRL